MRRLLRRLVPLLVVLLLAPAIPAARGGNGDPVEVKQLSAATKNIVRNHRKVVRGALKAAVPGIRTLGRSVKSGQIAPAAAVPQMCAISNQFYADLDAAGSDAAGQLTLAWRTAVDGTIAGIVTRAKDGAGKNAPGNPLNPLLPGGRGPIDDAVAQMDATAAKAEVVVGAEIQRFLAGLSALGADVTRLTAHLDAPQVEVPFSTAEQKLVSQSIPQVVSVTADCEGNVEILVRGGGRSVPGKFAIGLAGGFLPYGIGGRAGEATVVSGELRLFKLTGFKGGPQTLSFGAPGTTTPDGFTTYVETACLSFSVPLKPAALPEADPGPEGPPVPTCLAPQFQVTGDDQGTPVDTGVIGPNVGVEFVRNTVTGEIETVNILGGEQLDGSGKRFFLGFIRTSIPLEIVNGRIRVELPDTERAGQVQCQAVPSGGSTAQDIIYYAGGDATCTAYLDFDPDVLAREPGDYTDIPCEFSCEAECDYAFVPGDQDVTLTISGCTSNVRITERGCSVE